MVRGRVFRGLNADGEAKFWLEPSVKLAQNFGLSPRRLEAALRLIKEHEDEIHVAWKAHFRS